MAACMYSMGSLLAAASGNASAADTDSDTEVCYIIQTLWHGYAAYNALTRVYPCTCAIITTRRSTRHNYMTPSAFHGLMRTGMAWGGLDCLVWLLLLFGTRTSLATITLDACTGWTTNNEGCTDMTFDRETK